MPAPSGFMDSRRTKRSAAAAMLCCKQAKPNDYDLAINLATAKTLGLTIPAEVRANANAVIE
jgi:hypothetical protein